MSFEYNGFIHRDLEPQVRYDAEQIQLLKQANIDINNKIDALPIGGEKVSITVPQGATNGTITGEQLAKLQENEANYIEMVNDKELYYLNDNGHVDGYLTYSHVGIENSKATIKTLTITVSAKSFVIVTTVVPTDAGGGKLYRHYIRLSKNEWLGSFYMILYNATKSTQYTLQELFNTIKEQRISGAWYGSTGQGPATVTLLEAQSFRLDYFGSDSTHIVTSEYVPDRIVDTVTEV